MLDSVRIPLRVLNAAQLAGIAAVAFALAWLGLGVADSHPGSGAAEQAVLAAARAYAQAIDQGLHAVETDARNATLFLRPGDAALPDGERSALLQAWLSQNPVYREAILVTPEGGVRAAGDPRRLGQNLARQTWFARARNAQMVVATGDAASGVVDVAVSLGTPGQSDRLLLRIGPDFFSGIDAQLRRSLALPGAAFTVTGADGQILAGGPATGAASLLEASAPTRGYGDLASSGWLVTAQAPRGANAAFETPGGRVLGFGLALTLAAAILGYALAGRAARPLARLAGAQAPDGEAAPVSRVSEFDALTRVMAGRARSSEAFLAGAGTGLDRVKRRLQTFEAMSGWSCWEIDPATNRVIWADRDSLGTPAAIDRAAELTDLTARFDPADHDLLALTIRAALAADGPHDVVLRTRAHGASGDRRVLVRFLRDAEPDAGGTPRLHALSRALTAEQRIGALRPADLNERRRDLVLRRVTDGIVHDFNAVLTVVQANLGALRRRHALEPDPARLVDAALTGALRGTALTRRLLHLVRGDAEHTAGSVAESDLAATVAAFLPFLQANVLRGTPVIDRIPADLPRARCGERFLEVLLLNVAFHFRDLGLNGFAIGAAAPGDGEAPGLDLPPGPYLRLLLASGRPTPGTGPRTSTTEALATVALLLGEAGGGLHLVSDGTAEAAFLAEIWLPAAERARAAEAPPGQPDLRILLVESDSLVRASLAEALIDLGHRVVQAASGEHALALLAESAGYDAMIADQSMPVMTGLQLAATVVERHPGIRIILASPHGQLPSAARAFLQLDKPFRQEDLAAILGAVSPQRAEAA
ncbi:response regulator [Methylobacterium planeticum]|uniref:histidine kinase n=1 Tax=Methylobacterium planeticum TaxID=2615211 RepID=A0A6N6MU14_9HYPH|nr:response regulator [Methylobacterium planeticum]KAB1074005.1 response regulator [Methylobacterium planeticum]